MAATAFFFQSIDGSTVRTQAGNTYSPDPTTGLITITVPPVAPGDIRDILLSGCYQVSAFGGGGASFASALVSRGTINKQRWGSGTSPAATGADNVVAVFSLPANSFDVANREIEIEAVGEFAANADTKTCKIIFNPATAVVGSTVGSGGTTLVSSGAVASNGLAFLLKGRVFKYGAPGSNTQIGYQLELVLGGTNDGMGTSTSTMQAITATENAAIPVCFTANAATTATDVLLYSFTVIGIN
jgi:hypothetical protein